MTGGGPGYRTRVSAASATVTSVNLGSADPAGLARFYRRLLGGELVVDEPGWVILAPPTGIRLNFQQEDGFRPPVWPAGPDDQQMMLHLEVRVDDLEAGVRAAVAAGATLAGFQPQTEVRVCLDPAGHPFCVYTE
jgi:catechol 2,3-dioxygenase-like lactoylglutathione lyase family enzyme